MFEESKPKRTEMGGWMDPKIGAPNRVVHLQYSRPFAMKCRCKNHSKEGNDSVRMHEPRPRSQKFRSTHSAFVGAKRRRREYVTGGGARNA